MSEAERNPEHGPAEGWIGARSHPPARRCCAAALPMVGLSLLVALTPVGSGAAVQISGPFELVDRNGATRTDADLRGSYMLIYFGLTHCPDTCPTALSTMGGALEALAALDAVKARRVVPVFISVDPERDTPEALRSYAEHFDPRLVAVTGTPRELVGLGRAYGVFSAKMPTGEPSAYLIDYTSFIYLIGSDGSIRPAFRERRQRRPPRRRTEAVGGPTGGRQRQLATGPLGGRRLTDREARRWPRR